MIAAETATVYRGGGRRWFTLRAACRAEARQRFTDRARQIGAYVSCGEDEALDYDGYVRPRAERLARWLIRHMHTLTGEQK